MCLLFFRSFSFDFQLSQKAKQTFLLLLSILWAIFEPFHCLSVLKKTFKSKPVSIEPKSFPFSTSSVLFRVYSFVHRAKSGFFKDLQFFTDI